MSSFTTTGFLADFSVESLFSGATFIATAIVVLGVLILVHEYGHYIVARWVGVRVEKFSIGFGPRIISWKRGETDYILAWIPLGGYVKFYGDNPDEDGTEDPESFLAQKVWKRLAIVAAGPAFNIVLAVVILFGVALYGVPTPTRTVGGVEQGSAAHKAGLLKGDIVYKINGAEVADGIEIDKALVKSGLAAVTVEVTRSGGRTESLTFKPDTVGRIGVVFDVTRDAPIVAQAMEGTPAGKAGFRIGDTIMAVGGEKVATNSDVVRLVSPAGGRELVISLKGDDGAVREVKVTPEAKPAFGFYPEVVSVRYGLMAAMVYGMKKTVDIVDKTLYSLNLLITREVSHRQIAGPIGIMQMAGSMAEQGMFRLFFFIALISVNLGILNLLPIPILDGGHILFFSLEALIGKPINLKVQEMAQSIGLFLLLSLMALAFYNDIMRNISG